MSRLLVALPLALLLAGCASKPITGPLFSPKLTPVGQGISPDRTPLPASFSAPERHSFHSLWSGTNQGLFRDLRARNVGEIVTVLIDIDDKAEFENQTGRSRVSGSKGGIAAKLGFGGFGLPRKEGDLGGDLDVSASTHTQGEGSIDRSEKLRLSIAAVVTEVLPGGNLLLSGSQEVMVNNEVRVLNIAGIVRPLDISSTNEIPYHKIAEARISYGGRGRISEVQQPAWGQRLYDAVIPY